MSLLSTRQTEMYARFKLIRDTFEGDNYLAIKATAEEFHVTRDQMRAVVLTQEDHS